LALGGSDLRIGGGHAFKILSATLGWRFAKRCRLAWQGLRRRTTLHRASATSSGLAESPDRQSAELTHRS
jgi:hypothetical protein